MTFNPYCPIFLLQHWVGALIVKGITAGAGCRAIRLERIESGVQKFGRTTGLSHAGQQSAIHAPDHLQMAFRRHREV